MRTLGVPVPAIALALTLGLAASVHAQTQGANDALSASDCALLAAYRYQLVNIEVQQASRDEILRQLRTQPPLALVDGYWVSPVDLLRLLDVAAGLDRAAFAEGEAQRRGAPRDLVAFAFTPGGIDDRVPLPYVGDFESETDRSTGEPELVIVPVKDADEVVVEYLPPPIELAEGECYYFCGDPAGWDFDGDGAPNAADDDDDDDGVPDRDDAYPYWAGGSDCDCGGRDFVGFTEKFSTPVTQVILAAYETLREPRGEGQAVSLRGETGDRPRIRFLTPGDRCETVPGCPDASAPGVRYVSEDPDVCARVRFRCDEGEEGFSNACGCGCRPSGG